MTSLLIAAVVFGCVFGGAVTGVLLQGKLPQDHRDGPSKEAVQLVMGLIATMAALVLSLLIASTHTFYTTQQEEVQKLAVDIVLLDEALSRYGPETQTTRQVLRRDIAKALHAISPDEGVGSASVRPAGAPEGTKPLFEQVQDLRPSTPPQQFDQAKALDLMAKIAATRLLIHEQTSNAVPLLLVVVLISWLTFLFLGFGLFARPNATVFAAMLFGAFSVAAAIFLILDMNHPYSGLIHVDTKPIRSAFDQINR